MYMYIGIGDAKKELERDYRPHKISTLCTRKESNIIINVKIFIKASALQSFAWKFDVMTTKYNSSIFNNAWDAAMCRAQQNNPSMSITEVEAEVWMPAFTHCKQLLDQLHSQVMPLADVEQYFKDYERTLQRELEVLFHGVNQCLQKTYDGSWICHAVCRIKDYRNLHNYCYAADCFLRLRDSLKLTKGDFKDVERISKDVI